MSEHQSGPVLLSYDGSADAEHTIRRSGSLLGGRPAIVLHVARTAADAIAAFPTPPGSPSPIATAT